MIKLNFLGAISSVGASGILVETEEEKILLDYGTKIQEIPPKFPLAIEKKPDAIFISHSHLDHVGGVPVFFTKNNSCPIYATSISKPITELLLLDSIKVSREEGIELPFDKESVDATIKNFLPIKYGEIVKMKKTRLVLFDAGHIPGSALIFLDFGNKTLLYTGDYNTNETRLLNGANLNLPKIDFLITESTYSDRNHPKRKTQEKELVKIISETLSVDGICIIACFAVARAQEILLVLDKYGIDYPLYIDGMAKKATTIINQYSSFIKEPNSLNDALDKIKYVDNRMRKKIVRDPCVIITSSGMLSGGPISYYIERLHEKINCSLVLTGYQVEGSPGKTLLETGKYITKKLNLEVKMFVKRLDFSSHVGRDELFKSIEKMSPEKIFCVHGDHTEEFASELRERGFDAIAPLANNRVFTI
ncbi:MAG: MBL fold metallo-hydrolase [Candidatus Aenigmatarchaeota archaeon]